MLLSGVAVLLLAHVVLPDAHRAEALGGVGVPSFSHRTPRGLQGTRQACENEGEVVPPHLINIQDINCFTCMCQSGFVECKKALNCPSMEGCHMKLLEPQGGCCKEVCKGCLHEGQLHASGTEWRDPRDPCRTLRCEAGVLTESALQCYTPCHEPVPPASGQCCPTCAGCQINGQTVTDERNVTIPEDPCLKCHCERGGRMTCVKRSCPVLQCPEGARRPPGLGECCPKCIGQRPVMEPPQGICMLAKDVHRSGDTWSPDHCTHCKCTNGTSVCRRQTCPVLECAAQHTTHGQCCPKCQPVDLKRNATCTIAGHTYKDGESWRLGPCKSCLCHQGQVRCAVQMCPACPTGFKEERHPGECCQRCVESDGVCAVFGDPHYKTFDGKFYSFQGSCKYQLATDCVGKNFSIRVTHDSRHTKTSSWTKTISLKMGELKVNLGQKMRVKVNGKRIEPPYHLSDKLFVNKTDESVRVHTHLGVGILWDGYSFAEVYVPTKYKGHMCGLCGDFNGNSRNDFVTRRGRPVQDADKFGTSWRVGGVKACTRPHEDLTHTPQCQQPAMHKRNFRRCEPLKTHPFAACHRKVNFMTYFKACMVDMCECPTGRCYCESFTAYAHECQRLGVPLRKWRSATGCVPGWAFQRRGLPSSRLH
ncbi:hypothetical protein R5R35_007423 [Gryllus longicercus]|uniref:BMP-binding endothelial regulator protein n=1 Tax=Gryllus longicercus TaxID=2509291 RepID=A0AAN9VBS3_9ORTH